MMAGLFTSDEEQAEHHSRQHGQPQTAMGVDFTVRPRYQPDADQRQHKAHKLNRGGHAFAVYAGQHRQHSRNDRSDRRDDAHASDGKGPVQRCDAKGSRDAGGCSPQ